MNTTTETNILIIGSGPAGYTAAIYAARSNLKPTLITGYEQGGQLSLTSDVENFPGFAEPIMGPELMRAMQQQARNVGTNLITDHVTSLERTDSHFVATTAAKRTVSAKVVILATGAQAKWLGIPGEKELLGKGVSSCATCDGFFFKNASNVCVIGGGNTAVEEALHLSSLAQKVTLLHRRDQLRATPVLQDRLFAQPNISVLWNTTVEEVLPNEKGSVGAIKIGTKDGLKTLETKALFVAIGHTPNTQLVKDKVQCDEYGYIIVKPGTTQTNLPGLFAAGDVHDSVYRQAITAAASGCMAALEAERFLHD